MATKTQVLNWFRGQLGYVEDAGNRTKYAAIAGHANGQPWCATFQVAGFRSVGMKLGNESAYTPSLRESLGAFKIGAPQTGAIAFLYMPTMGRVAHCAIVESVRTDGRFVTIEGNTDVAGGRTGGQVMRKVRSRDGWSFYMPRYSTAAAPAPVIPSTPAIKPLQLAVRRTANGFWDAAFEKHMNALRSSAGFHGGTHPFGVKFTQLVVGATQDGVWGASSIAAHRTTTANVQKALNNLGFKTVVDSKWGSGTEQAYQGARAKY